MGIWTWLDLWGLRGAIVLPINSYLLSFYGFDSHFGLTYIALTYPLDTLDEIRLPMTVVATKAKLNKIKFNNYSLFFYCRSNSLSWCSKPWCFQLLTGGRKNDDSNTLPFKNVCIIIILCTKYDFPSRMIQFVNKLPNSPKKYRVIYLEHFLEIL